MYVGNRRFVLRKKVLFVKNLIFVLLLIALPTVLFANRHACRQNAALKAENLQLREKATYYERLDRKMAELEKAQAELRQQYGQVRIDVEKLN